MPMLPVTHPRTVASIAAAIGVLAVSAAAVPAFSGPADGVVVGTAHPPVASASVLPGALDQILSRPSASTTTPGSPFAPVPLPTVTAAITPPAPPALVRTTLPASTLAANGIPTAALRAYKNGAKAANARTPGCHIVWPLVAAIGRVESDHGRFADNVLHADGVSTPGIVGIPLNGNGTEVVRDTDDGRVDGDRTYDRAVGPMQFIPSTWAHWRVDADHDGKADINDIDDAAAATAGYLCAGHRDLRTYAGQRRAVLSYNHSTAYLKSVLALEKVYAHGVITVPTAPGKGDAGKAKAPKTPKSPSPATKTGAAPGRPVTSPSPSKTRTSTPPRTTPPASSPTTPSTPSTTPTCPTTATSSPSTSPAKSSASPLPTGTCTANSSKTNAPAKAASTPTPSPTN